MAVEQFSLRAGDGASAFCGAGALSQVDARRGWHTTNESAMATTAAPDNPGKTPFRTTPALGLPPARG